MEGKLFQRRIRVIYGKEPYDRGTGEEMLEVQKKNCTINSIL